MKLRCWLAFEAVLAKTDAMLADDVVARDDVCVVVRMAAGAGIVVRGRGARVGGGGGWGGGVDPALHACPGARFLDRRCGRMDHATGRVCVRALTIGARASSIDPQAAWKVAPGMGHDVLWCVLRGFGRDLLGARCVFR